MFRLFVFSLLCSSAVLATDLPAEKVFLRGMDKITGHVRSFETTVGQTIDFEKLSISVDRCYTTPADETPESKAFLTITETLPSGQKEQVFRGWMFASDPAFSAMEHPIYDIWVLNCTSSSSGNIHKPQVETIDKINVGRSLTEEVSVDSKQLPENINIQSDDESEENLAEDIIPKELL